MYRASVPDFKVEIFIRGDSGVAENMGLVVVTLRYLEPLGLEIRLCSAANWY